MQELKREAKIEYEEEEWQPTIQSSKEAANLAFFPFPIRGLRIKMVNLRRWIWSMCPCPTLTCLNRNKKKCENKFWVSSPRIWGSIMEPRHNSNGMFHPNWLWHPSMSGIKINTLWHKWLFPTLPQALFLGQELHDSFLWPGDSASQRFTSSQLCKASVCLHVEDFGDDTRLCSSVTIYVF